VDAEALVSLEKATKGALEILAAWFSLGSREQMYLDPKLNEL
jgi:hypothetical protein